MTPESTVALLRDTLSPDPPVVLHAEHQLHSREFRPSFLIHLFQIAIATPNNSADAAVALAGAIYFKNLIRRAWQNVHSTPNSVPSASFLPQPDRDYVRVHIVPALASVETRIRAQLLEALKRIISADFPLRYSFLIQQIMDGLASSHSSIMHGALSALRALAKVYEIKIGTLVAHIDTEMEDGPPQSRRTPPPDADLQYLHDNPLAALNYLIQLIFPPLLDIMCAIEAAIDTADPIDRDKHFDLQRVVCKIFWSCTQYDLPTYLTFDLNGVLSKWMNVFLSALRRPPFNTSKPLDDLAEEDLRAMPQWKVKQWICNIVYRLFHRYNHPTRLPEHQLRNMDVDALTKFGDYFRRTFAAPFTLTMLQILELDQRSVSPRVVNLALLYVETAVSTGITYKVIKPTLQPLITNVIFPYLCITDGDLLLWDDDPIEYVRKTYNVHEDFNTPRSAACSLLHVLATLRRSSVLAPLMTFLMQVFNEYSVFAASDNLTSPEAKARKLALARRKDGALLSLGAIREPLATHPQGMEYLNAMLETHVLQDFDSDVPILRARACWLFGQCAAADRLSEDMLHRALTCVHQRLSDPEFPVRVRAAVDIRHFVQNAMSSEAVTPHLPDLLRTLFTMLDDVDSTDIVATIDQLAVVFSDRIIPLAPELCARLVQAFSRSAAAGHGDEEASFAAAQCLQAVASIVTSVALTDHSDKLTIFSDIEQTLAPVFNRMFEEDRLDFFEEAVELLATIVYHSSEERASKMRSLMANGCSLKEAVARNSMGDTDLYKDDKALAAMQCDMEDDGGVISTYLWSLFPRGVHAFHEWASDYAVHYIQLVDAYMTKGMRVFMLQKNQNSSYAQLLISMISRLWEECAVEEQELAVQGSQLCGLFLRHSRRIGRKDMDTDVSLLTQMAVSRLLKEQAGEKVVVALIWCLAHLLYIAPVMVLTVIDQHMGCTTEVFKLWLGLVQQGQLHGRYDCKSSAIALCAIIGCDWMQLPVVVRQSIPQLLVATVSLLEMLAGMEKRRNEIAESIKESAAAQAEKLSVAGSLNPDQEGGDGGEEDITLEQAAPYACYITTDHEIDTGDVGIFAVVDDVDELLLFESVVQRVPAVAWQQIGMALAQADTIRVQTALNRAAQTRTIATHTMKGVNDVSERGEIVCD